MLLDYIHRQKFEAAAVCGIDPKFWVELDYIINLVQYYSSCNSDENRTVFIKSIIPLIRSKINDIDSVLKHLPEKEFFYLTKDLKLFRHIFSNAANIAGKKLDYFLPLELFAEALNSMTVLYPLSEKSCDMLTIARNNYPILLARYIANDFSSKIVEIIDYFIWFSAVSSIASDDDRRLFRENIVQKLSDFTETGQNSRENEECTAKPLVLELHEVLTEINIKNSIRELLDKILTVKISIGDCLKAISSIFIDIEKNPGQNNLLRDLSIASELAASVVKNMKEGNNRALYEDIHLSKALKPYFMQVSRYMFNTANDLEICRLFEIMSYIEETFPAFIMHNDIIPLLEKSMESFEAQKSDILNTENIQFDMESAELFRAKAKQIYAGKL